ncbi:MAG: ATP-binding protein [Fusobacteriota bacterium]
MNKKTMDLFRFEKRELDKANKIINDKNNKNNPLLKDFKSLAFKYKKLMRQSEKILKISDDNQKILRETQNNLEILLNNSDQGFLTFGDNFIIDNEYSLECEKIFEKEIKGDNILDLIFNDKELYSDIFFEIFTKSSENIEPYVELLPKYIKLKNKHIKIKYKLIGRSKKIMCILTDITDKVELEKKLQSEKNNLRMVINAVTNQNTVRKYIEDYKKYFNDKIFKNLSEKDIDTFLKELYREVHTYKGIFCQWYMDDISEKLNQVENKLDEFQNEEKLELEDLFEFIGNIDFESFLKKDIKTIENTLGDGFLENNEILLINKKNIIQLEKKAKKYLSAKEFESIKLDLKKLRSKPFKNIFKVHREYLKDLSKREGKKIKSFIIEGDDELFLDESSYYDFNKSLIHIFRNIISHGIEFPEERKKLGKTKEGNIYCEARQSGEDLEIIIRDDGSGINTSKLKERALRNKIYKKQYLDSLSKNELLKLIFEDNISTEDKAGKLSGRGVGMSAVREEVLKLGGKIKVKSRPNKGTEFKILLPLIED